MMKRDEMLKAFARQRKDEIIVAVYTAAQEISAGNGARISRQENASRPSGEQLPQRDVVSRVVTWLTLHPCECAMAATIGKRTSRASCFSQSVTRRTANSGRLRGPL